MTTSSKLSRNDYKILISKYENYRDLYNEHYPMHTTCMRSAIDMIYRPFSEGKNITKQQLKLTYDLIVEKFAIHLSHIFQEKWTNDIKEIDLQKMHAIICSFDGVRRPTSVFALE